MYRGRDRGGGERDLGFNFNRGGLQEGTKGEKEAERLRRDPDTRE